MELTTEQLRSYAEHGYLLLPDPLPPAAISTLDTEVDRLLATDAPGRLFEVDDRTVRAVHGCHRTSTICDQLVRQPMLLDPAHQILGQDVYLHQFKINVKAAFSGDVWQWHQDFIFWNKQDGIADPRLVNVAVFCDDVNEFNGPLYFIPGSHIGGMIDVTADPASEASEWSYSFSAKLKYALEPSTVTELCKRRGLVAPKGPAGTVLLFHPNIVHGSVPNISPYGRRLIVATYNSLDNTPRAVSSPRPEFLVSRDYTPLEPALDDTLTAVSNRE